MMTNVQFFEDVEADNTFTLCRICRTITLNEKDLHFILTRSKYV